MKKYLFGLFAVALAVAFSAFTAPKKASSLDPIKFEYRGASEAGLQTPANWTKVDAFEITCPSEVPALACKVEVSVSGVTDVTSLMTHLSSNSIDTEFELVTATDIDVIERDIP